MKRALFLLGSTRGKKTGTESTANYLGERLEGYEFEKRRAHEFFQDKEKTTSFIDELCESDLFVMLSPVYVHSLPWPFLEVLKAAADSRRKPTGKNAAAVIHSGYIEPVQRRASREICRNFCNEISMNWLGSIDFGASPLIDGKPLGDLGRLGKWIRSALDETALCLSQGREISIKAEKLMSKHLGFFPRRLLLSFLNIRTRIDARKKKLDLESRPWG